MRIYQKATGISQVADLIKKGLDEILDDIQKMINKLQKYKVSYRMTGIMLATGSMQEFSEQGFIGNGWQAIR